MELVVSSLLVRVAAPERGVAGFRLVFEGELTGGWAEPPAVAVAIAAVHGSARAEARGSSVSGPSERFRVESGLLGGAGDYRFGVRVDGTEIYCGRVTIDAVGVGFAVAPECVLDRALLWFDEAGEADAPVLSCSFWCADVEPAEGAASRDPVADLSAALYFGGLPILRSGDPSEGRPPVELRLVDVLDAPDAAHRMRRVRLRVPGARAFVLGDEAGGHDLSAHPGSYALRVTRGNELAARAPFEIDWHGVLRASGPVECRADGTPVMLVGQGGGFGPAPARGAATLDPVYARYFAAMRGPQRLVLDELQSRALERVVTDVVLSEGAVALLEAGAGRAALHELLTRVEELESVVPGDHPVPIDGEQVPFERLRPYLLRQLRRLDDEQATAASRR